MHSAAKTVSPGGSPFGRLTFVDLAVGPSAQGRSQLQVVHHAAGALAQRLRQAQHIVQLLP